MSRLGSPAASEPARIGDRIGEQYEIVGQLGRGASGVVYEARTPSGGLVALKLLLPEVSHDRQLHGRLHREAQILRRLRGSHIVNFLDFVEDGGLLGFALEHVAGSSLETMLETPVELALAVDLGLQLCRGLEQAHEQGVIHRDLKPANIMVSALPDGGRHLRILDFGLAKVVFGEKLVTGLTERDMIFGTPEYMAPEQARGDDADHRCDLYAAGVILYEMLTGCVPIHAATPLATMTAQLHEPVPPLRARAPERQIPAALEAVVMRALEKEPNKRHQSAAELATALAAASERRVVSLRAQSHDNDAAGDALDAHDTELSFRKSQIKRELGPLLEAASALAAQKRQSQGAADALGATVRIENGAPGLSAPKPSSAAIAAGAEHATPNQATNAWLWIGLAMLAIMSCVAAGVWLALR